MTRLNLSSFAILVDTVVFVIVGHNRYFTPINDKFFCVQIICWMFRLIACGYIIAISK